MLKYILLITGIFLVADSIIQAVAYFQNTSDAGRMALSLILLFIGGLGIVCFLVEN